MVDCYGGSYLGFIRKWATCVREEGCLLRWQRFQPISAHPRPRLCRGKNRTMVVVAVQGAPRRPDFPLFWNIGISRNISQAPPHLTFAGNHRLIITYSKLQIQRTIFRCTIYTFQNVIYIQKPVKAPHQSIEDVIQLFIHSLAARSFLRSKS